MNVPTLPGTNAMITVPAAQIIYARVEREHSPRRVSGFQTLFHSAGAFSAALLEEAESLFVFDVASTVESKLVFCAVGHEKLLIARLTRVAERDGVGRRGNFIAHALVLSQRDFARLGADPVGIARGFQFCGSLSDAMRRGDLKTGHIPVAELAVKSCGRPQVQLLKSWTPENMSNLLLLAASVEELRRDGRSVAIVGAAERISHVLESVFAVLPVPLRCRLSFASRGDHLSRQMALWAQGYTRAPDRAGVLIVDADRGIAESMEGTCPPSSFTAWLKRCLRRHDVERAAMVGEQAWRLCELIDHGVCEGPQPATSSALAEEVWTANARRAEARLFEAASEVVGGMLARRVAAALVEDLGVLDRFGSMGGVDDAQVARSLSSAYRHLRRPPERKEQDELVQFLRRRQDPTLRAWLAAWRTETKLMSELLASLPDQRYEHLVADLCGLEELKAARLYVCGRGERFAAAIARRGRGCGIDMLDVARSLVNGGEADALRRLIPLLRAQPVAELASLQRYLVKNAVDVPLEFATALSGCVGRSVTERPAMWKRLFGR